MTPPNLYIFGGLTIFILLLLLVLLRKSRTKAASPVSAPVKAAVSVTVPPPPPAPGQAPVLEKTPVDAPVPENVPDAEKTFTSSLPVPDLTKRISGKIAKPQPIYNDFARLLIIQPPLERMSVYSVNNGEPLFFTENGKTGIHLPEGTVEIKVEYSWPRRGVMYTPETVSSGIKKVLITPVEGRTYYLSFNTDKESFVIS